MVCHGPDPPDNAPYELNSPPRNDLLMQGAQAEDSDEEQNEVFGYEPLPQGPEAVHSDHENSDNDLENNDISEAPVSNVPTIEPMDHIITREVWNSPRPSDPIEMDSERAQQVMSAMANFALPQTSIPEWAQSISEDQWKQTLRDRIEKIKENR